MLLGELLETELNREPGARRRLTDRMELPDRLQLEVIDDQQVVGIWRDSLGIQPIRRYRWA